MLAAWRPGNRKNQAITGLVILVWPDVESGKVSTTENKKEKRKLFMQKCGKIHKISCHVKKQVGEQCGMCATFCIKNEENETTWIFYINLQRETVVQPCAIEFFPDDENVLYFSWLTQQPLATDDTWIVANVTKEHNF